MSRSVAIVPYFHVLPLSVGAGRYGNSSTAGRELKKEETTATGGVLPSVLLSVDGAFAELTFWENIGINLMLDVRV